MIWKEVVSRNSDLGNVRQAKDTSSSVLKSFQILIIKMCSKKAVMFPFCFVDYKATELHHNQGIECCSYDHFVGQSGS